MPQASLPVDQVISRSSPQALSGNRAIATEGSLISKSTASWPLIISGLSCRWQARADLAIRVNVAERSWLNCLWQTHRGLCTANRLLAPTLPPFPQTVEVEVNDWSGIERERLAENQSTRNSDAEGAAQFRANAA